MPYSQRTNPLPIDVRRAVLAVLIRAGGGPLTIAEIVQRTKRDSGLDLASLPGVSPEQRVSDIMRHQARMGCAVAIGRAVYQLDLQAFSMRTRWRCLHWAQVATQRARAWEAGVRLSRYLGEPWDA